MCTHTEMPLCEHTTHDWYRYQQKYFLFEVGICQTLRERKTTYSAIKRLIIHSRASRVLQINWMTFFSVKYLCAMIIRISCCSCGYVNLNFSAAQHYLDTQKLRMNVCGRVFRRAQIFMGKYGKFHRGTCARLWYGIVLQMYKMTSEIYIEFSCWEN